MRMVGPVLVVVGMHRARRRQFTGRVRVRPLKVPRVIVTIPPALRIIVGNEQILAVMPAITEDVIIFLALRRTLVFA